MNITRFSLAVALASLAQVAQSQNPLELESESLRQFRQEQERQNLQRQQLQPQPDVRLPASVDPTTSVVFSAQESPCFVVTAVELSVVGKPLRDWGWLKHHLQTAQDPTPIEGISAGAGQVANSIGDLAPNNPALKALAHALAGCVAGSAGQGGSQGCTAGAAGAVVGELAAQWYNPEGDLSRTADTVAFASLMAGVAGALATGDGSAQSVNTAVTTGANAALNNYLNHADIDKALKALESCEQSGQDCEPLRRQVAVHLNREHSELTEQGSQIPVHRVERDCVLNGCANILQDIDKGLATLQDPRARELLGETVVQGLIDRQIMDLSRVY